MIYAGRCATHDSPSIPSPTDAEMPAAGRRGHLTGGIPRPARHGRQPRGGAGVLLEVITASKC